MFSIFGAQSSLSRHAVVIASLAPPSKASPSAGLLGGTSEGFSYHSSARGAPRTVRSLSHLGCWKGGRGSLFFQAERITKGNRGGVKNILLGGIKRGGRWVAHQWAAISVLGWGGRGRGLSRVVQHFPKSHQCDMITKLFHFQSIQGREGTSEIQGNSSIACFSKKNFRRIFSP